MTNILELVADLYEAERVACDGMLVAAARELRVLAGHHPKPEAASTLPVCRHLPAVFASARQGPLRDLAEAFEAIAPIARWRQNPNYTAATIEPAFLENYGYVELVGRDRPWLSEGLAVGFLLLGPGAHYPAHKHPAAEVYHVVSGCAEWSHGAGPLAAQSEGTAIFHAPNVVHQTRVLTEPLLALYCWTGEINIAARLLTAAAMQQNPTPKPSDR